MLKSTLLFSAGALLALATLTISGRTVLAHSQQAAFSAQDQVPAKPGQKPAAPDTAQQPADAQTPAAPAAPAMAPDMKNPVKPTADSQARAKQLYSIDCAMCHGDNGNGKTDLDTSMEITPGDFTDSKTLAGKMDGELFNQIRNGKDKMPPEDPARAKDNDVWNLVIYVRNFSKPQAAAAAEAK